MSRHQPARSDLADVIAVDGSNIVVAGGAQLSSEQGQTSPGLLIMKLSRAGTVLWSRTHAICPDAVSCSEWRVVVGGLTATGGGFAVTGTVIRSIGRESHLFVARLSATGDVLWVRTFDGPEGSLEARGIIDVTERAPGAPMRLMVAVGLTILDVSRAATLLLDETGHLVTQGRMYVGMGYTFPRRLRLSPNNEILFVGETAPSRLGGHSAWIVALRPDGTTNTSSERFYHTPFPGPGPIRAADIAEGSGSILLLGLNVVLCLSRLDHGGGRVLSAWQASSLVLRSVAAGPSAFVVAGSNGSNGWLGAFDGFGSLLWQKEYPSGTQRPLFRAIWPNPLEVMAVGLNLGPSGPFGLVIWSGATLDRPFGLRCSVPSGAIFTPIEVFDSIGEAIHEGVTIRDRDWMSSPRPQADLLVFCPPK